MEIFFNGAQQEIPAGTNVSEFLAARNLNPETLVVELNDDILSPDGYGAVLKPQDRLNAFRIVAGG